MKKADLKQLIKPLVKECIHEVLLEEGLLSNVVAEVAKVRRRDAGRHQRHKALEGVLHAQHVLRDVSDGAHRSPVR